MISENKYGYYGKLNKAADCAYLAQYLKDNTQFLDAEEQKSGKKFITWAMRAFYVIKRIDHILTCCVCGKPFISTSHDSVLSLTDQSNDLDLNHLHCCHLCAMRDSQTQSRITETFLDHYGTKSCFQAEPVKKKIGDTNEDRYGVRNYTQSDDYRQKGEAANWWPETEEERKVRGKVLKKTLAKKTPEQKATAVAKTKATTLKNWGVENYNQSQQSKDRYKNKTWSQQKKSKEINTKIKNGTLNSSKPEKDSYQKLCDVFGLENVKRQYHDDRYPFMCDFYIRHLDLFIELNGHWTHGPAPYDSAKPEHQVLLEKWISKSSSIGKDFYMRAIKTWTVADPLKYQTAQENELHYIVFWTYNELAVWADAVSPEYRKCIVNKPKEN